ncbi:hypothetical protein ACQVP2_35290 [Methylobacterium aquaticum]|uniref:hypothetical protein n=1 Tax=Methylobacterium aquaticum TaxID=270351 RepID=UPI003D1734E6
MRLTIAAAAVALLSSISAGGLPTFSVPVKLVLTPPPMPSATTFLVARKRSGHLA